MLSPFDTTLRDEHSVITQSDIESAEWEQSDPQMRGRYAAIIQTHSDNAEDAPDPIHEGTTNIHGSTPILPTLTLQSSDVAPGVTLGRIFPDWYQSVVFDEWFTAVREKVTLRLCGLKFAHLAPGDRIDVFMGQPGSSGTGFSYGPVDPGLGGRADHILDSIASESSPLQGLYTVMAVKVDWVGIKVHLTLSRRASTPPSRFLDRVAGGDLTDATGLPQRDIDPDI
tara:strand:+ start:110 stop:787 length:678 start_codon:yes stop_codon:yes gene_type:complete